MEFYFQDQLRWSYGFDNPNKAAALIASLLPLFWVFMSGASALCRAFVSNAGAGNLRDIGGVSQRRPTVSALKRTAVFFGAAFSCAGWWLLFKTYSRGGIAAAVVAFCYIGICHASAWKRNWRLIFAGLAVVAALFIFTQAAQRSVGWIGNHEGSVENRLVLWKGGLEMLAANPNGVGRGKSGELYMQWFQPSDMAARYRTLVNSYLTFAVEQGIWVFGASLFLAVAIWNIGGEVEGVGFSRDAVIGLQAVLLAFAVAGFFSTTMEEMKLWAAPILCAGVLVVLGLTVRKGAGLVVVLTRAAMMSLALCGILYAAGWLLWRHEPLRITLHRHGEEWSAVVEPSSRNPQGDSRRWRVIVDRDVMGEDYGKLVRRLALATGARITAGDSVGQVQLGEIILIAGEGVKRMSGVAGKNLVLLAPARMEEEEAAKILREAGAVKLLLPGFDEDGRVAFWKDAVANAHRSAGVETTLFDGVGTQVESAWDTVIGKCGEFSE